jgi:hypothetical protein
VAASSYLPIFLYLSLPGRVIGAPGISTDSPHHYRPAICVAFGGRH